MKRFEVGDLVRFPETGYTGVILAVIPDDRGPSFRIFVNGDVGFANPTHLSLSMLGRCAEVINASG
jgi:hypothetical protein